MTDLVAKVVDCQRLADRLIENKGSLEGDTVLRHDPDEGCRGCPLRIPPVSGGNDGPWWCGSGLIGARSSFGDPAPNWCPLRKGRVVVERGRS